jgi:hypothetical protein
MIWPETALGSVTVGAMILFGVIDVAMHYLRSDLDPTVNAQSRYVMGEWGFLMTIAFLVMGAGSLSLAIGLGRTITGSTAARLGLTMLAAWSICIVAAAFVRIDPLAIFGSTGGLLQTAVSVVGFICAGTGAAALTWAFRHDDRWRRLYRISGLFAAGIIATLTLLVASSMMENDGGLFALSQRAVILSVALWMLLVGSRLKEERG